MNLGGFSVYDDTLDEAAAAALRRRKRGGRKHKGPLRRVLAVPDLILEIHVADLRENALRSLSGMLNDVRGLRAAECGPNI